MTRSALLTTIAVLFGGMILGWSIRTNKPVTTTVASQTLTTTPTPVGDRSITEGELTMRESIRKLWVDRTIWMNANIATSVFTGQMSKEVTARLMKNAEDMGNTLKPFYGDEMGNQMTELMKSQTTSMTSLLSAIRFNDRTASLSATDKATSDSDTLADFLSKANPNLSNSSLRGLIHDQSDLLIEEVHTIKNGDYTKSIQIVDALLNKSIDIAAMLSDGIVKQFPDKF